jgi:predicted membrane protein
MLLQKLVDETTLFFVLFLIIAKSKESSAVLLIHIEKVVFFCLERLLERFFILWVVATALLSMGKRKRVDGRREKNRKSQQTAASRNKTSVERNPINREFDGSDKVGIRTSLIKISANEATFLEATLVTRRARMTAVIDVFIFLLVFKKSERALQR